MNIAFSPLKLKDFSVVRTPYLYLLSPMSFISLLACEVGKPCYIGETKTHLNTSIEERLGKETNPALCLHL